jgi:hypothetical protein
MGVTMFDYPHKKIRVKPVIDRCRSAWCSVCRKLEFKKNVIPRLKEVANLWAGVRKLVITTDPKRFPEGCTADVLDQLLREKSDFERRLKEKYHGKIYCMFSWIEFQESGFPHWHYLIFTDQKGKTAMIGEALVHELWDRYLSDEDLKKSNQWIHEGFFKSKSEYLQYMGYAEKTGYFIKEKAHQVQLPPLLMTSKRKIRAYYFSIKFGDGLTYDNSVSSEITEQSDDLNNKSEAWEKVEYEREAFFDGTFLYLNQEINGTRLLDMKNVPEDLRTVIEGDEIAVYRKIKGPENEKIEDKEKIKRSFELCPKNWRDKYGSGWRLRYTEEELKSIGDEIKGQEEIENEGSEDQGLSLDMRNDLSNEEKQARCGKRIKFIYFTENYNYLGKSEFFPYDDKVTFTLREKYLIEEKGKGLFFKDHVHDEEDASLELSSAFRDAYKDRQNKVAGNLVKRKRPELYKIINQVFSAPDISIRKKKVDKDDESFEPYLEFNSVDEYQKSKIES